jgi:2,3-bisphosphoglycerate-dependent phosphoglycerate mutase
MALAAWVGREQFELGEPAFLKAFFSTVYVKLEAEDWGGRFPVLMRELYSGRLSHEQAAAATAELAELRKGLESFEPSEVVWDFENRKLGPPWGDDISPHITSLRSYFVTSDGRDLLDVLEAAFATAARKQQDVVIS